MKRALAGIGLLVFLHALAIAQSPTPSPKFDVADVHASAGSADYFAGVVLGGGRYQLRGATMADLIATAWSIDADAVFGGPSWLESDRFDVIAKASPAATKPECALMLRALLADRFKLAVHSDEKPLTVYALTVGKRGPQFKESAGGGEAACKPGNNEPGPPPFINVTCSNMTLAEFGDQVHQMANAYAGDHPVVDLTGLKGVYDLTLRWTPRGALRQPAPTGDAAPAATLSVFDALDKQLGLKLELAKRPMPVVVVDSVNRKPTENAPGATKTLPSAPTEFEAATIKQNKSGADIQRIQSKPGGRIEVENIPLVELILLAWGPDAGGVGPGDHERIVGAPKWVESDRFDIVAKTAILPGEAAPPFDDVRRMLEPLLMERFKMKVHNENQPVTVWALTVGKRGAKLKEADPGSRSSCKRAAGETGTGSAITPALTYTCQNTSMAQLAEAMHQIANGYVDRPAVDIPGLKGGYDFTITWTPSGVVRGQGRAEPAQPGVASDPSGGITFFDAVDKQLGLRLEGGQKHPMPVLVIDHIEQLGVEN